MFIQQSWVDEPLTTTPLDSASLNRIEQGIADAHVGSTEQPAVTLPPNADYTITNTDHGKRLELMVDAGNFRIYIPTDGVLELPTGWWCSILNTGAGNEVLLEAVDSMTTTLNAKCSYPYVPAWGQATLVKRGANLWFAYGDLLPD